MGSYLEATFDLAGVVPDNKYYVPRSCGQCHGTTAADQQQAKVNYLDTDHWIDRTGDDFTKVSPNDVLVDGEVLGYATFRSLNMEIEQQNAAVLGGGRPFALLAVRKRLELHRPGEADERRHVPPLRRGFREKEKDAVWTEGATPDKDLLPMLNQYCFCCHSSLNYHVFQKQSVIGRKGSIGSRLTKLPTDSLRMPQDRILDEETKTRFVTT